MKKVIALWMYRNDGGAAVQEKLKLLLEKGNVQVINNFDMRNCYCLNGRVYTENGYDLSSVDILYHMNADEQTPFQNTILRLLEMSGVKVVNSWEPFHKAKDKLLTNQILRKNNIRVPPSLFLNSKQAIAMAPFIFREFGIVLIKPRERHGGKGIIRFQEEELFKDFVELTQSTFESYYIEKFIDFDEHDYRIEIFDNKVIGGYCRAKIHSYKTNLSSTGMLLPLKPNTEFEKIALKTAATLDITTTIVDMVLSKADNLIYVLEVNPIMGIYLETAFKYDSNKFKKSRDHALFHTDREKILRVVNYLLAL